MRNATNAARHVARTSRLGAFCAALIFAVAGPSVAVADDIYEELSSGEVTDGSEVVVILDGGIRYEGSVHGGKIHGEGKVTFPDGRIYKGEFANGQIEGEGTYSYPDDHMYVGEFRNGKRNGYGRPSRAERRHQHQAEGEAADRLAGERQHHHAGLVGKV